jgi:hypothetical protein
MINDEMKKILEEKMPADKVNMPERVRKRIAYRTAKQRLHMAKNRMINYGPVIRAT